MDGDENDGNDESDANVGINSSDEDDNDDDNVDDDDNEPTLMPKPLTRRGHEKFIKSRKGLVLNLFRIFDEIWDIG